MFENLPKAKVAVPVFVPLPNGEIKLEVAEGTLKSGTLVIEFNDRLPGLAIQRMLERGILLGLSFVMLEESVVEAAEPQEGDEIDDLGARPEEAPEAS